MFSPNHRSRFQRCPVCAKDVHKVLLQQHVEVCLERSAEGASAEQLDDAADADDPKAAVIELLLALSHDASDGAELRAELEALRLKALRQRARAEGFGTEALDHAADSDDPKAAMVELLMGKPA